MSTTLAVGRVRLLQELDLGFNIPNTYLTAFAVGSFTAAFFLNNTTWGGNQFQNKNTVVFRPTTATAADAIRYAGALTNTTGLMALSGGNYTDTTVGTETVELWYYGIRADTDVLNAANRALEDIYFQAVEPLSLAADAAMRESNMASWGTASSATAAKQTTASRVYPGFLRSFAVTNSGANGYQPTANIAVTPYEPLFIGNFGRLHSGTAAQQTLYDVTNGAVFGSTVSHSNSNFKFMWQRVNAPSGCYNINVRLGGSGASDVTDWCGLWVARPNDAERMVLQSYDDERFKLDSLAYSNFHTGTVSSGVYEGLSLDVNEIPASDYSSSFSNPAASPNFIQFHANAGNSWWNYPLWIQMRLPYSERGTLSAESDTTTAPLHLWLAAWKRRLLESPGMRERVPNGTQIYAEALKAVTDHQRARTVDGPARRRPTFILARTGN